MKRTALFLAGILAISSLSGCGAKNSASDSSEPFEGKYVVTADYVKENLDDIIVVDARGEDEAKKGTVKGAVATTWQYLATCEDGEAGDANWGCILDTKRLSERLGELGLAKDKEIVLFSNAEKGWGEDGRIAWELIAAGYEDVKIVDGGIKALKAAGVETVKGVAEPKPVSVEIDSIDETHVINTDELKEIYDDCKIVDTRTDKEYNGKTMYGEANGGHLPGAIQIRYTDLFNSDSTLKSNEDLTKMVNMIESQINNGDYTAMDLAAAFLYQALGKAEREGVKQDNFDFSDTGAEDGMVRLFINIGKKQRVRPGDILGAVAGESGMPGDLVGAIDMFDSYTFVEVPREYGAAVLKAMKNAKIKGKSINVEPANAK